MFQKLRASSIIRQIYLTMAVAILLLSTISSLALFWQFTDKENTTETNLGRQLAENLARQSRLALVYDAPDNAAEAVAATMSFPDVAALEIRDARGKVLLFNRHEALYSGFTIPIPTHRPVSEHGQASLEADYSEYWQFVAPVTVGEEPRNQQTIEQPIAQELGTVRVVKSKATLRRLQLEVFLINFGISAAVSIALMIFVRFVTIQITQPLRRLAASMAMVEHGNLAVRADPEGPWDVKAMALTFNKMAAALEEREKELRVARDEAVRLGEERITLVQQEQDRLEQQVAERTKTLQELLDTRAMMVNNASHELRTPINELRLVLDSANLESGERRGDFKKMDKIVDHMTRLAENLLLVEANRAGVEQRSAETRIFDLAEEIRQIAQLLDSYRQHTSARLEIVVQPDEPCMVQGDLISFKQILINLLSNAFKFTEQGTVEVVAHLDRNLSTEEARVIVLVRDTGVGIQQALQERIFDPFVTSGSHRGHTGTGLGLSISRQLAKALGGDLRLVKSVEGVGSEFELTARFASVPDESVGNEDSQRTKLLQRDRRLNILLAEDEPITAEAMGMIISHLQHDVTHVGTIDELRDRLNQSDSAFDYALLDNRMPGGRSIDVVRTWRAQHPAVPTKVILLTADTAPTMLQEAQQLFDQILVKPTRAAEIRALLGEGVPRAADSQPCLVLDEAPLAMLKESGATDRQLNEMCALFKATVRKEIAALAAWASFIDEPKAREHIRETVHRIRSACATVGAHALGDAFKQLALSATAADAEQHMARIEEMAVKTEQEIAHYCEEGERACQA